MRSPLSDSDALDGCPANRAGFPCASIHAEIILKFAPAINPIYRGTVVLNAGFQNSTDGVKEYFRLFQGNFIRFLQWVDARQMKRFVRIDISHPCQKGLVEQERLDLAVAGLQAEKRTCGVNAGSKGSGPRLPMTSSGSSVSQTRPNFRVSLNTRHFPPDKLMSRRSCFAGSYRGPLNRQITAHAQVNEEIIPGKLKLKEFSPPADIEDFLSGDSGSKDLGEGVARVRFHNRRVD